MLVPEIEPSKGMEWFYIPEMTSARGHIEVKRIESHHLLTRHRSAICKGDLGFAKREHFVEVSRENTTPLKAGMMEEQLNMQSTDYARITFSAPVEHQLRLKGHSSSADLCRYVREWFQACDDPGISATDRCRMKYRYKKFLLSLTDLSTFPPVGSHVRGYPVPLWEATIASVDADIFMYAICKRRTYNNRALSSQPCENLFSCLATMPGARNGVPSCVELEVNMAKICGESIVRQDPNRGFGVRLSNAPVYPQVLLENDTGPLPLLVEPPTYIHCIPIKDHLFDAPARLRRARKPMQGISSLHEPGRGAVGVRSYHKVNENKMNPLIRAGLSVARCDEHMSQC
ncbi:uncharacterized protein LOC124283912 [Haliotis rubra]|uniref:uncharacterized protein LOC124283912 n=1 Tax=Haliotis rubra TaxID=36100 RepID=UPI001EE5A1C2|nr:uncharacterized protein LOC124283912 [Haliotis rubra]